MKFRKTHLKLPEKHLKLSRKLKFLVYNFLYFFAKHFVNWAEYRLSTFRLFHKNFANCTRNHAKKSPFHGLFLLLSVWKARNIKETINFTQKTIPKYNFFKHQNQLRPMRNLSYSGVDDSEFSWLVKFYWQ